MDKTNGFPRRSFFGFMAAPLAAAFPLNSSPRPAQQPATEESPNTILLKDYRPHSLYKTPRTRIARAKFPIIDVHSHDYAKTDADVAQWVRTMDEVGVEKTVILSSSTGAEFDAIYAKYSKYPDHFEIWCGFDTTGYDQPGYGPAAVRELERCHQKGAKGVGELGDKGEGMWENTSMHPDDPRVDPLFEKCAQLGMPVNIHVSDPIWAYEPMDKTNDGLMNGWIWRINLKPGIWGHNQLIESLERTAKKHPKTVFIACHLANLTYDLSRLGQMFDRNPNLFADTSARFQEIAPIPRFANQFIQKYSGRLLYGTDHGFDPNMYGMTFRIMESNDEHYYDQFPQERLYHWPLYGLGVPDDVLKKIYHDNALIVFRKAQNNAA